MEIYILTIILVLTLALFFLTRKAAERIATRHYDQRSDFFRHHPVNNGDIVFLGDSITDGACWEELFPGFPVKNRGINADTVRGVFERLEDVTGGQPAAIFLLIGTNDLAWYVNHKDSKILITYEKILHYISTHSPETQVFVQSILPRHPSYASRILKVNGSLEQIAKSHGYAFINLFPHFSSDDLGLRPDLSNDRLHLMSKGYSIWTGILTPYLEEIKAGISKTSSNP